MGTTGVQRCSERTLRCRINNLTIISWHVIHDKVRDRNTHNKVCDNVHDKVCTIRIT